MRVAIVGTNDPHNVSGGRYHALMLAYAVADLGWESHLITDNRPSFFNDLDVLAPGGVRLHLSTDFIENLPSQSLDWVIIVPTGIFLPEFYGACLDFARRAGARIGLINFESATWFNAIAPKPRDPRLWDDWRRVCVEGALVLSSARESNDWARQFYGAPDGPIRFEVWQPPINSVAARRLDELEKDGSIVAFIRPQDTHKGSGFLTELDPRLFANRTLNLISGREAPASFRTAIASHLRKVENARAVFYLRINDQHKFRLLTAAQAVLFPSRFEGYGYPPVEAAYSGTESVVFDLPVLRETVGGIAHFAPTMDAAGFESAMRAALARPERRTELRRAVFEISDFHHCARRLADVLLRSADIVRPLTPRGFRALVGPFAKTPPAASETIERDAPTPPFPPYVVSAVETTGGDLLATVRAFLPAAVPALDAALQPSDTPLPLAIQWAAKPLGALREARLYILAPKEALGQQIVVTAPQGNVPPIELRIDRVIAADPERPALAGVSENHSGSSSRRLRAWALAREPLVGALLSPDGRSWLSLAVDRERRDIGAKFPAYGTTRCEFQADIPAAPDLDRNFAVTVCIACLGGSMRAVDALVGWPPAPTSYFTGAPHTAGAMPAPPAPERAGGSKPRRPKLGEIALALVNDARWRNGVALNGDPGRLGAVAALKDASLALLKPGAVLRFTSGVARRIVAVQPQNAFLLVTLDGPLRPEDAGYPARAAVHDGGWTAVSERQFVLFPWTDSRWWRGVWNARDRRFRCGLTIKTKEADALRLEVGTTLRFAASGLRKIREIDENSGNMRIWLDGPIRPLADMEPHPIVVVGDARNDDGIAFTLAKDERHAIDVGGNVTRGIRRGGLVQVSGGMVARVLSVSVRGDGMRVVLDRPLETGGTLGLVDEADAPDGYASPYRCPGFNLNAKDALFRVLAHNASRRGSALPLALPPAPLAQRRALVISAVSPCPANQGNRVVTRNLIRHLVALGLQCDVVVQNWVDAAAVADEFGADARFFVVSYPNWQASGAYELRQSIAAAAEQLRATRLDGGVADVIERAATQYHPYFIVRNETVDLARALYGQYRYDAVVVNYTHMVRVAEELQDIRPLPPTAIITHDALSRLPREFGGKKLDLMYRACSPETERAVFDAIPGACIVAISKSEADYFRAMGVMNRIVTTEYDAAEEMAPFVTPADGFERRTIIFHGSANPMNVAGLNWFVDECWAQILAAAPRARLVVCGAVGTTWNPKLPGIEIVGEQPRARMLELCAASSVAINPCVAGTGLKIKTVETAALGLPAVCLPTAIDGLEDIAGQFAIVAVDAEGFAAGCITLLTDRERWSNLRDSAFQVASHRFAADTVYDELDEAMGWRGLAFASPAEPALPADEGLPEVADPLAVLEHEPDNEAAHFALGKSLARGSRAQEGWSMVDQIASSRLGDWRAAMEAAELGLQIGAPWRGAVHAARLIAQRPTQLRGYLLMGRALLACDLPHEAVAAFEQGLMVAPFDDQAQRGLVESLVRAKRPEEAEKWRARPAFSFILGQYAALRPSLPGVSLRGFQDDAGDLLALQDGEGTLLLPEPHGDARRMTVSLDIACPKALAVDVTLELSMETSRQIRVLRARGPGVQTVKIAAEAEVFASGFARLGLRIISDEPLPVPLRLIGLVIDAEERAGGLLAFA